jgi:phosphonatase-like hydrolase
VITLAVLDMAGTTVSDGGVVEAAFVEALGGMGFDPDGPDLGAHLEYVRRTMGQSKIDVFTAVFDGDERRAHEANGRFEAAFDGAVSRGEVAALPGAEAALGALRAVGVRVCLTTGFSRDTREQVIDVLGWRDLVDLSLSPEPGLRGRPFPDLILTALMRLDIDGVRSVAVAGDTTSDVISGHRAGARVVAGVLTGAHDRARLSEASPTHVLAGIDELPGILSRLGPDA